MALQHGVITREDIAVEKDCNLLALEDGWHKYRDYYSRPRSNGGVKPATIKRYRAVFEKFIPFALSLNEPVKYWQKVTAAILNKYVDHLNKTGRAYQTGCLEVTTVKQAMTWLIENGCLDAKYKIKLKCTKAVGTTTYCWTKDEVTAQIELCSSNPNLHWLGEVLTALASTGLRISELANLKWSDIDFDRNNLNLKDESMIAQSRMGRDRRETKSSRSRVFPLSTEFRSVLLQLEPKRVGTIFHGPLGAKIKPDTVRNILIREVLTPLECQFPTEQGSVGFKDGRLHSFRHYFCSACANNNVPELMVMNWLGHSDSAMVHHYYHANNQEAQRRMSEINFIGTTVGTVLTVCNGTEAAKVVERTAS